MNILKIDSWRDIPKNYTGIIEYPSGDTVYYLNRSLHRDDGPAVICSNGNMYYNINNKNITKEVKDWIKENNIPEVWDNSHKILFKLTFG